MSAPTDVVEAVRQQMTRGGRPLATALETRATLVGTFAEGVALTNEILLNLEGRLVALEAEVDA